MDYDCIVLDLDGSLVHSSYKNYGSGVKTSFTDCYGEISHIWVHKRPGFDIFLDKCFEKSVVGVWSMGQPGYVDAIVNLFPRRPHFVYNWCNCDRKPGRIFKRLDSIPHHGSILMIDDNKALLEETPRVSTLIIPKWHPRQPDDKVLYDLASSFPSTQITT